MRPIVHQDRQGQLLAPDQDKTKRESQEMRKINQGCEQRHNPQPVEGDRDRAFCGRCLAITAQFFLAKHGLKLPILTLPVKCRCPLEPTLFLGQALQHGAVTGIAFLVKILGHQIFAPSAQGWIGGQIHTRRFRGV